MLTKLFDRQMRNIPLSGIEEFSNLFYLQIKRLFGDSASFEKL